MFFSRGACKERSDLSFHYGVCMLACFSTSSIMCMKRSLGLDVMV